MHYCQPQSKKATRIYFSLEELIQPLSISHIRRVDFLDSEAERTILLFRIHVWTVDI